MTTRSHFSLAKNGNFSTLGCLHTSTKLIHTPIVICYGITVRTQYIIYLSQQFSRPCISQHLWLALQGGIRS